MSRWSSRRLAVVTAIVGLLVAACGGDSGNAGPEATSGGSNVPVEGAVPDTGVPTSDRAPEEELPPPNESEFTGRARVVNLWLDDSLETIEVDVWAGRSFTNGPVLLAEGVGFGEVSDYFSAPDGQSIVFTPAGSGPDAEQVGSMFNPAEGEQILAELVWDDGASIPNRWEIDPEDLDRVPPAPAGPNEGVLALRAGQLTPWEDDLTDDYGGRSFYVGDGAGICIPQTVEEAGFDRSILGGTQPTYHRLAPGSTTVSLHRWLGPDECAGDPVFDFEVEVAGGGQSWVFVYTPDGETLDVLVVPIDVP